MAHPIEIDFHRDWLAYIRHEMKSAGHDQNAIKTDKELIYGVEHAAQHLAAGIEPRQSVLIYKTIWMGRDLSGSRPFFSCGGRMLPARMLRINSKMLAIGRRPHQSLIVIRSANEYIKSHHYPLAF